ncbi:transposase [Alcanivorax sp. JB21]|uniref:transposase n=1 Tax=Alcanivorax limicola TaxID=2874102 RepID=UPI001CBD1572|nr:transposase [Alcanivorax limicola]MBZ2188854.1 transposase [Alcanivorax limicola]
MYLRRKRHYSPTFKALVALSAIKDHAAVTELARQLGLPAKQIETWRAQLVTRACEIFDAPPAMPQSSAIQRAPQNNRLRELKVFDDFQAGC